MRDNRCVLITDIDHIQIAAPEGCEAEARKFFGEVLGLEEMAKPEPLRSRGGCWFRVGTRRLHVGVESDFHPAKKAHPAFTVSDIDGAFARLRQNGVDCTWDEAIGGMRRFYAADPWDNRLEFTEPTNLREL
jgi:catechol 2,3-dioxygenase-like lactoylglutathione lyase family enzyme